MLQYQAAHASSTQALRDAAAYTSPHTHPTPYTGMPESAVAQMMQFDLQKKRVMLNQHLAPSTPSGSAAAGAGAGAAVAGGAEDRGGDHAAGGATASELARQLKSYTKHSPPSLRE